MAPLEHHAVLSDQCKRPLLRPKRGAFLYPDFRAFTVPAKRREDRHVRVDPQRIVAPVTRCDHPAVEVEDPLQLPALKGGDWAPVPSARERRDDAQALFTF